MMKKHVQLYTNVIEHFAILKLTCSNCKWYHTVPFEPCAEPWVLLVSFLQSEVKMVTLDFFCSYFALISKYLLIYLNQLRKYTVQMEMVIPMMNPNPAGAE